MKVVGVIGGRLALTMQTRVRGGLTMASNRIPVEMRVEIWESIGVELWLADDCEATRTFAQSFAGRLRRRCAAHDVRGGGGP